MNHINKDKVVNMYNYESYSQILLILFLILLLIYFIVVYNKIN
jgi:hypothetical protein